MATGRRSNAICDRCGFRCKYADLRSEVEVGVWVCAECFDGAYNQVNHPQNMSNVVTTDDPSLDHPRPDTSADTSTTDDSWTPDMSSPAYHNGQVD
jgi:hypothetical protein